MAIVDDLVTADPEQWLPRVSCPTWLVSCEPGDVPDEVATQAKAAAYRRAEQLLAHPRVQHWHGALHDVPLQWPSLVAGLIRAAVEEAGAGVPSGADGEGEVA